MSLISLCISKQTLCKLHGCNYVFQTMNKIQTNMRFNTAVYRCIGNRYIRKHPRVCWCLKPLHVCSGNSAVVNNYNLESPSHWHSKKSCTYQSNCQYYFYPKGAEIKHKREIIKAASLRPICVYCGHCHWLISIPDFFEPRQGVITTCEV